MVNINETTTFIDRRRMIRFNSAYSRKVYNNGAISHEPYANINKNNMLQEVYQFDNSCNSYNITDLFSLIYHNSYHNETIYTNGPKRLGVLYYPNKTGILNLLKSKNHLALNNISLFDYCNIERKQNRLYEELKDV